MAVSNHQLGSPNWLPWLQQEKRTLADQAKGGSGGMLEARGPFGKAGNRAWEWVGPSVFPVSAMLRWWQWSPSKAERGRPAAGGWSEGHRPSCPPALYSGFTFSARLFDLAWVRWLPLG